MNFERSTGEINLLPGLNLRRGMAQLEVLAMPAEWEGWSHIDGVPFALRAIIELPNRNISPRTILIVHFRTNDSEITGWDLVPWDFSDGSQYHRAGKYKKHLESWFREMFGTKVPCGGDWGYLDSSYEQRDDSAAIICNYREAFMSNSDWNVYKRDKKFR